MIVVERLVLKKMADAKNGLYGEVVVVERLAIKENGKLEND